MMEKRITVITTYYYCQHYYYFIKFHDQVIRDKTINAERYTQVLEQHVLPSTQCLFQGCAYLFRQHNAKPNPLHITTAWLREQECRY